MATSFSKNYELIKESDQQIKLDVKIGFAQIASTRVRIDNVIYNSLPSDDDGNYKNSFSIILGSNKSLSGKNISIVTNVARIQDDEPNTSVLIKLTGGKADSDFPLLKEVAAEKGDTVCYDPEINFI